MKITITETMFKDQFANMGRQDNFSYAGLSALFYFLEELEDETGTEIECDVIALCCDFSELTIKSALEEYSHLFDASDMEGLDDDELAEYVRDTLNDNTIVIPVDDDTVIVQAF